MKRKKITELSQTHGKLEQKEYKTLEQVWGNDGYEKYKTLDESEYLDYLKNLNKSDLQTHASKIGLLPVESKELLIKKLIKEFKIYASKFKIPKQDTKDIKLSKEIKDILSEGK